MHFYDVKNTIYCNQYNANTVSPGRASRRLLLLYITGVSKLRLFELSE